MAENLLAKKHFFWCTVIIIVIFLFSIGIGYWMAINYTLETKFIIKRLFGQFDYIKRMNNLFIFLAIFLNNAIKGFVIMLASIFFGLAAVIFIFLNGQLIGMVLGISNEGAGPGKILIGLLPHGILEVPAIILSAALGLWLGYRFYHFLRFKEQFNFYLIWALKKFLYIILPLFFVAALIETFITPYVINRLMQK